MKKTVTFAMVAGASLALAACGGKEAEAPAAEPAADEEMMVAEETPAEEMPAADATPAAGEVDPTGNPIGPN